MGRLHTLNTTLTYRSKWQDVDWMGLEDCTSFLVIGLEGIIMPSWQMEFSACPATNICPQCLFRKRWRQIYRALPRSTPHAFISHFTWTTKIPGSHRSIGQLSRKKNLVCSEVVFCKFRRLLLEATQRMLIFQIH